MAIAIELYALLSRKDSELRIRRLDNCSQTSTTTRLYSAR